MVVGELRCRYFNYKSELMTHMSNKNNTSIEGVKIVSLNLFADERGAVSHMLRCSDPHFIHFGEIYFSTINLGVTKAWKNHKTVTANYACIYGEVRFVMYDERDTSSTRGNLVEINIGPDNYSLIVVPPGVWNGFHGFGKPFSIVASCSTEVYNPDEFERIKPNSSKIPYQWPEQS